MRSAIQFIKEIYLTGFAILFRHARVKEIGYKVGFSIVPITVIQWFALLGIWAYVEMFLNKNYLFKFSKAVAIIAYFVLFFINVYFLFFRKHGIKFAYEFDCIGKTRKIFLIVSWVMAVIAVIAFVIFVAVAHQHFISAL